MMPVTFIVLASSCTPDIADVILIQLSYCSFRFVIDGINRHDIQLFSYQSSRSLTLLGGVQNRPRFGLIGIFALLSAQDQSYVSRGFV